MPVYNAEKYLSETLESLLGQTLEDFEIIAIDDGSTDSSWQILKDFAARDPRVRIDRHPTNRGQRAASNLAFSMARGAYVARSDQDDLSLPRRLELQSEYLDNNPEVGVLSCTYYKMTPEGQKELRGRIGDHLALCWTLLFDNAFCHSTLMLRREFVSGPNAYHYAPAAYEYEICSRLSTITQLAAIEVPLVIYRVHPEGLATTGYDKMRLSALAISSRQLKAILNPYQPGRDELCALRRLGLGKPRPSDFRYLAQFEKLFQAFSLRKGASENEVYRLRLRWVRKTSRQIPLWRLARSGLLRPTGLGNELLFRGNRLLRGLLRGTLRAIQNWRH